MDQLGQPVRKRRAQAGQVRRVAVEASERCVGVGLAKKRNPAGEAFVQHEAQRVEVGAPVELLAADLLGRQVLRCPHHDVGTGEVVAGCAEAFGDAEVGQQHAAIGGDQDVAGLHVAVHEPGAVGGIECRGHARTDVDREIRAQPSLLVEELPEALAVDELHDHGKADTAPGSVFDGVVHRDDVGMAELGDGHGFAAKALGDDGIGGQGRLQQLDRDLSRER